MLHADAALLQRALGNLVDNAVRHGDGTITVTAARPDTSPAVILSVHDEGSGISPGFLAHALERFRQDESSRTGGGAGLGLPLVDAIVTAHGGQLRICAAGHHHDGAGPHPEFQPIPCRHPEAGTTVSLLLPAVAEPRAD
jgi:two-component system OmpR family sensor kinase